MQTKRKVFTVKSIAVIGVLSALSIVLVWAVHFPILASFLEYDPADIPILVASLLYGPVVGLTVTVVTAVVQGLTVSAESGIYGIIMHIIATGCLVLVSSTIYKFHKTIKGAILGLAAGVLAMTGVMLLANMLIVPLFNPAMTADDIKAMLLPVFLPFNLLKGTINAVVTFFIYKPISRLVTK